MSAGPEPVVHWRGAADPDAPLVVLLRGRGSHEQEVIGLAELLPTGEAYAAVRAPIAEGGGFAWVPHLARRDRPTRAAGRTGRLQRRRHLHRRGRARRPGPLRRARRALRHAAVRRRGPDHTGRLSGVPVLVAHGDANTVIPVEVQTRTWQYLHDGSGAAVTGRRSPGGPAITGDDVAALAGWLTDRTA